MQLSETLSLVLVQEKFCLNCNIQYCPALSISIQYKVDRDHNQQQTLDRIIINFKKIFTQFIILLTSICFCYFILSLYAKLAKIL